MGHYCRAQICTNGHAIVSDIDFSPELCAAFCSECSAPTIDSCPNCGTMIRGYYDVEGVIGGFDYRVPKYCHNCGAPYPWTKTAIETAKAIVAEDDSLSDIDKEKLIEILPDAVSETPKTNLAAVRIKKILSGSGKFVAEGIRQFAIDFGCELLKKQLGL